MLSKLILGVFVFVSMADIALCQEMMASGDVEWSGGLIAKVVGYAVAAQFFLYGAGEALTRISVMTETKWDNKAAAIISQTAWYLGVGLSKFGYSMPKKVIERKAEASK